MGASLAFALGRADRSILAGAASQEKRLDAVGGVLVFALLTTLLLGLSHLHGGEPSFSSGGLYHLPLLALSFYCLITLLIAERRAENPILPLLPFRNHVFSTAIASNGILHMTMLGIFFLTPFFMERGLHLSTTHVAILLTSQQFYNVMTSYLGGWLHDKTHARWIRPVGMGLICLGFFTLSLTTPVLTFASYMLVAILIGLGMGTFMSVNNAVIMSAVPGNLRGFASGMLETTRQGGHMFAVPLLSSIMTGVAGMTLTAQADPALYIRGFQAACMVVGCIALIALAFAFVPEGRKQGKFRRATPVGLADSPSLEPGGYGAGRRRSDTAGLTLRTDPFARQEIWGYQDSGEKITFATLIDLLLGRLEALSLFHCGGGWPPNTALCELASHIKVVAKDLRLQRPERYCNGEEVYLGGGSGRILFDKKGDAENFAQKVRALYQQETANARVSVEAAERREGESFPDWMARGVRESQRNKLARVKAPPLVAGWWIRPCTSCGVASPEQDPLPDVQGNHELCISCWKEAYNSRSLPRR